MPEGEKGCFGRHTQEELEAFLKGIKNAEANGMQQEFVDAVLFDLERGESMRDAIWFANCEWDL